MTKPVETGIRHANEWFEKLTVGRFKMFFDPKESLFQASMNHMLEMRMKKSSFRVQ